VATSAADSSVPEASNADTFAGAVRLANYLIEHARAVFDLMGADHRLEDARWLLDWISRTNRTQFSRRDAHAAAPRGRFPKATDLEPPLRLLEEHGYLRRVDPEPSRDPQGCGRPASPRFLVNPQMRDARLSETAFGGAAKAASPTLHPLSRYPTRTAPAVRGHVRTRLRPPPAATGPPGPVGEQPSRTGLVGRQGRWRR
jgi:hypothetical protein